MRKRRHFWGKMVTGLGALLFSSCIDWDSQTVTYRYVADTDELRVFFVYEGILARSEGPGLCDEEKGQLLWVIEGEAVYLFDSIASFDREEAWTNVKSLTKEIHAAGPEERPRLQAEFDAWRGALKSLRVFNGQFYINDHGKLSGYQGVVISDFSQLISKFDRAWRVNISEERKKLIRQLTGEDRWLELDGNRLTMLLPEDDADFLQNCSIDGKPAIQNLRDLHGLTELVVGDEKGRWTEVRCNELTDHEYDARVLEYARSYGVHERLDPDRVRDAFLAKGRLP